MAMMKDGEDRLLDRRRWRKKDEDERGRLRYSQEKFRFSKVGSSSLEDDEDKGMANG